MSNMEDNQSSVSLHAHIDEFSVVSPGGDNSKAPSLWKHMQLCWSNKNTEKENQQQMQDGFIDFLEFIAAINLVIRGKIDQKLKWYFKLYDADGNGCIDKKELLSIFTAIQAINGHTNMSAEEFTNMIFQKIDVNNDGELTLEEFITGVERDGDLMELITKSFDLSNVLKVIQSGRRHSI
ncbi:guanylyl cyclase-activating protein 3 isoform X3 [Aythya fuligula]|uniref:Guanylyl cyclase-activating protein 3 isoform X3 n=1 Tax=Aythya fuligula TaxID=219594 RepID=A0A6J3EPR8_AYTFU|nr:guanylyl cyclase-activating protein 3 isoform X3 [Aythya fuligula]XP_032063862.1 guanylyl cyclase-activating protein 3 isoform X3 [Aythya fuligula]XP_032063863.1 guanylyl cyclase-activating protein 3 isoform X3 [Aythya fuligula]